MKAMIWGLLLTFNVYAIECDCEIRVYAPISGSHKLSTSSLKVYQLQHYDTHSKKNQWQCRQSCFEKYHKDMPYYQLSALLTLFSERLIEEKLVGYNCTGLTTLKYPVRVKASLGSMGLGNVADQMVVVNHEKQCF